VTSTIQSDTTCRGLELWLNLSLRNADKKLHKTLKLDVIVTYVGHAFQTCHVFWTCHAITLNNCVQVQLLTT